MSQHQLYEILNKHTTINYEGGMVSFTRNPRRKPDPNERM